MGMMTESDAASALMVRSPSEGGAVDHDVIILALFLFEGAFQHLFAAGLVHELHLSAREVDVRGQKVEIFDLRVQNIVRRALCRR